MSKDAPRPVLNIAQNLGLLILEWGERDDAWVIIAHDGKKYVVSKDSPSTEPPPKAAKEKAPK